MRVTDPDNNGPDNRQHFIIYIRLLRTGTFLGERCFLSCGFSPLIKIKIRFFFSFTIRTFNTKFHDVLYVVSVASAHLFADNTFKLL